MESHYLLSELTPGNIVTACFALDALVRLARSQGDPISREQAEGWLAQATPDPRIDGDPAWVAWRLDGIFA